MCDRCAIAREKGPPPHKVVPAVSRRDVVRCGSVARWLGKKDFFRNLNLRPPLSKCPRDGARLWPSLAGSCRLQARSVAWSEAAPAGCFARATGARRHAAASDLGEPSPAVSDQLLLLRSAHVLAAIPAHPPTRQQTCSGFALPPSLYNIHVHVLTMLLAPHLAGLGFEEEGITGPRRELFRLRGALHASCCSVYWAAQRTSRQPLGMSTSHPSYRLEEEMSSRGR